MIDLPREQLAEVAEILRREVPGVEVRAYGSRVNGTARRYSDLDLALVAEEKIDRRRHEALRGAFSESNLPIMVDVVDWNGITESFRKAIGERWEAVRGEQ